MLSWWRSSGKHIQVSEERGPSFEIQLDRAKHGNKEALSALYARYLPRVYGAIAARVPAQATAEDLTSEVFVKMVEGLGQVHATDEAGFGAWLFRVTRFTIAGYYRQRHTQPEMIPLESPPWEEDEQGVSQTLAASHPDYDLVRLIE